MHAVRAALQCKVNVVVNYKGNAVTVAECFKLPGLAQKKLSVYVFLPQLKHCCAALECKLGVMRKRFSVKPCTVCNGIQQKVI